MNIKKITAAGIMAFTLITPIFMVGCTEKSERVEIQKEVDHAPVVVPDRKVDVNVHTDSQPAPIIIHKDSPPIIIHKDTTTNTTVEKNSDTGVQTETKTESTSVH